MVNNDDDDANMEFREQSNGVDLNVGVTQESRNYSEHFRMYDFLYGICMNFMEGSDRMIFMSDLLNTHSDALERIFSVVLQTMVQSIQLQHFNRNNAIESDYLQFTSEHQDFVNYVYSSRSVAYENFNFERIIGRIMNWLNNLS